MAERSGAEQSSAFTPDVAAPQTARLLSPRPQRSPAHPPSAEWEWPGLAPWRGSRIAANVAAWSAPLRGLRLWRRLRLHPRLIVGGSSVLTYALAGSIALHAIALTIHFRPFERDPVIDRGPPLEVALVNAKSLAKPAKADILAQANLDGGGNTDAERRAKTPLPVLPKVTPDQELALTRERVSALEQEAREILTRLQRVRSATAAEQPSEATETPELPSTAEITRRAFDAMRLEAQIARDMDAYQKRPRRQFIGARAEEYRFARYVEDWRLKVERIGNLNYPAAARDLSLYGNLVLTVSIRSDGSIESIDVQRSSGHRVLDAAAIHIVEMGAPYASFPPDIRRDTDILSISRTWTFARGDELRTD